MPTIVIISLAVMPTLTLHVIRNEHRPAIPWEEILNIRFIDVGCRRWLLHHDLGPRAIRLRLEVQV